jgi:hypothetical protein
MGISVGLPNLYFMDTAAKHEPMLVDWHEHSHRYNWLGTANAKKYSTLPTKCSRGERKYNDTDTTAATGEKRNKQESMLEANSIHQAMVIMCVLLTQKDRDQRKLKIKLPSIMP